MTASDYSTPRFFNTAGPVRCDDHYCLPPLERFDLADLLTLIDQKKYFVLHAPRQTGKTSCLLALMEYLNRQGCYRALYINVEPAQTAREDVAAGIRTILGDVGSQARRNLNDGYVDENWLAWLERFGPHGALKETLSQWAAVSPQPLVLMIDEIDALVGDTLVSVLRQLRSGYTHRPAQFPQTIILCGVRDVRDYRIHSSSDKAIITGGSAFNIKAESLRLGDFNRSEMERLYAEHTLETGQVFLPEALDLAWEFTHGQPWLVNALGYETCFRDKAGQDRTQPITAERLQEAKENLILRRETHLDQLADKLQEERVRRVIEPMLAGAALDEAASTEDIQYVLDLGLVRREAGQLLIANAIYGEIIPRELTYVTQYNVASLQQPAWYVRPDGSLDLPQLMAAFQDFFRQHAESWVQRFAYKEAGPQLLLQAFLQRIVNGGGRVEREYGLGRMRTDLLVVWPLPDGRKQQRAVIELKILYGSLERTLADGLQQTWEYLDRCGAQEAHLVIFDRRPERTWEEKLFQRTETVHGVALGVWGM